MDYAAHYERLMARARSRGLTGYCERHHVLLRCMGGTNAPDNLVDLTPEEHYVAHQLLVKVHPGSLPLIKATNVMGKKATGRRAYGWLRRRLAAHAAIRMRGNKINLGRRLSVEHRAGISAALIGKPRGPKSASHIANHAAALRGRRLGPPSAGHRAKIAAAKRGKPCAPETKKKIAATLRMAAAARRSNQKEMAPCL